MLLKINLRFKKRRKRAMMKKVTVVTLNVRKLPISLLLPVLRLSQVLQTRRHVLLSVLKHLASSTKRLLSLLP